MTRASRRRRCGGGGGGGDDGRDGDGEETTRRQKHVDVEVEEEGASRLTSKCELGPATSDVGMNSERATCEEVCQVKRTTIMKQNR